MPDWEEMQHRRERGPVPHIVHKVMTKKWQCQCRLRLPAADPIPLQARGMLCHYTGEWSDANTLEEDRSSEVPSIPSSFKSRSVKCRVAVKENKEYCIYLM